MKWEIDVATRWVLSLCLDQLGFGVIGVALRDFDGYSKLFLKSWLYKLVKIAFMEVQDDQQTWKIFSKHVQGNFETTSNDIPGRWQSLTVRSWKEV